MDQHAQKLKSYITEHKIPAELLTFTISCHSVKEAAHAVGCAEDEFVKNICMIDSKSKLIVAIVKGEDRASTERVGKALGIDRPRTATPEEIFERTGYPCGGTPSFGYDAIFLVDDRVIERSIVYTGGGSEQALVRITSKDLLAANKGTMARVRK